jgi:hypothetical protein
MIWRRWRLGGQKWRAKLVSPQSKHLLLDDIRREGVCDFKSCTVYLARDLEDSALVEAFLHEVVHAILYVSQADEAYGKNPKIEERIVGPFTPMLHQFLTDLGLKVQR